MSSISQLKNIKLAVFGSSHGEVIGGVVDGLPYGFRIDLSKLERFLERRRPGSNKFVTTRGEKDKVKFLSGIREDVILGEPLSFIIENKNTRSKDYENLKETPRPSHVDYAVYKKFGEFFDLRGGGHFSGRLTAIFCVAGSIAKQILENNGIFVNSHLYKIRDIVDTKHNLDTNIKEVIEITENNRYSIINTKNIEKIDKIIEDLRENQDSTGGIVECSVFGLEAGIGEPIFCGIENNISKMIFAIPGVKGIEFGSGFDGALKLGSENNDEFFIKDSKIQTKTNNSGGILGGISNGMPINFRVAFKPTASIGIEQDTVNLKTNQNAKLKIQGRHDPCIAIRGTVVVEAISSIVILDYLLNKQIKV